MKVYLAARYEKKLSLLNLAAALEKDGHQITSRWIQMPKAEDDDTKAEAAQACLDDIDAADCLVLLSENHAEICERGGRHVEVGYALAKGKLIVVIGERENLFHWSRDVGLYHVPDQKALLYLLHGLV